MSPLALVACLLAVTPHSRLLVVNQGDKTVSVVDPVALREERVLDEHQTTMHAHEAAVGPDHNIVYLPVYGNVGVGAPGLDGTAMLAVDWTRNEIVGRVDFGHGVRPHCAVYEPVRKLLYVTTELDNTITVIDPKGLKIIGTVPTGAVQSHMLAITRDGKRGYTSNVNPGSVSVLDLVNRTTLAVIPISNFSQRIALSGDDRWVFTSDQTNSQLVAIDTKTKAIARRIDLPGNGYGTAATKDGRWLLIPIPSKNLVAVLDIHEMKIARQISVDTSPQELLIRPDQKFAYVAGASSKKVSVIDLRTWEKVASIPVGNYPDGLAWAE